jgi:hypothetical protein
LGQGKIIIIKPIIACFPMFHPCFQSQINMFLFKMLWRCCEDAVEMLWRYFGSAVEVLWWEGGRGSRRMRRASCTREI